MTVCRGVLVWFLWSLVTVALGQSSDWTFQKGQVRFEIRNAGLTVEGRFSELEARGKVPAQNYAATQLEGSVKVKSLNTGIGMRDRHLQKKEYFDAEKHPEIRMKLLEWTQKENQYYGTFDLTLKGVVKRIEIPIGFDASKGLMTTRFDLNRRDFGVGGSSWTLSDNVRIFIDFQFVRK